MNELLTAPSEIEFDAATHSFKKNGRVYTNSVTTVLKRVRKIDDRFYNEYARDRGTFVHLALQFYMERGFEEGGLDIKALSPAIRGYVQAGINFLGETGFEPWIIEVPFVDEHLNFCGIPDVLGEIRQWMHLRSSWVCINWKTGAPEDWHEWAAAGYDLGIERNLDTYVQSPVEHIDIHLKADGSWKPRFMFRRKSKAQLKGEFVAFLTTLNLQKGDYGL